MASVLSTAEDRVQEAKAIKITNISLTIGRLTEVMPDALQFAHQVLTEGTIAEGSTLKMTIIEPRSRCLVCGLEYEHDRYHRTCPACQALACELLQGHELFIDSIEVENAD